MSTTHCGISDFRAYSRRSLCAGRRSYDIWKYAPRGSYPRGALTLLILLCIYAKAELSSPKKLKQEIAFSAASGETSARAVSVIAEYSGDIR